MFGLNRLSAIKSETSDSFEKMSQNRSFVSTRLRSKPSFCSSVYHHLPAAIFRRKKHLEEQPADLRNVRKAT